MAPVFQETGSEKSPLYIVHGGSNNAHPKHRASHCSPRVIIKYFKRICTILIGLLRVCVHIEIYSLKHVYIYHIYTKIDTYAIILYAICYCSFLSPGTLPFPCTAVLVPLGMAFPLLSADMTK